MDEAKFILYKNKLLDQYNIVRYMADSIAYSFKTNEEVGKVLETETDCDMSIHSIESLNKIKDPKRVWLLVQGWNKKDIIKMVGAGVIKFIIDNQSDLQVLENYLLENDVKINLLLRVKFKERTVHTGKYYVYGFSGLELNKQIQRISKNQKFMEKINKLGIHFHRKTQNLSEWDLKEEIQDIVKSENLKYIQIINIGGGIPCEYKNFRINLKDIFQKIKEFKKWLNEQKIELMMEPGRFLAAPCIELETEIKAIYKDTIILNCSVYNSSLDTFIWNIRLVAKDEILDEQKAGKIYTLKGCTPDSMDIFRYRIHLPEKKVGDKIVFMNAGAYNFNANFCSLPKLKTEIVG